MRPKLFLLAILALFSRSWLLAEEPAPVAPSPGSSVPGSPWMIIVQPGYPGSTKDAEGFMSALTGYVGDKAGLKGLSGEYYNEEKKALSLIDEKKPGFGIVSVGFYLEHRRRLGLKALCQSKPKDNFVIVARPGELKDLSALKGQLVVGGPLYEKNYLERIVFAGKADLSAWDSKPTVYVSRALRDLSRDKVEADGKEKTEGTARKRPAAVLLTGRDHTAFKELYSAKTLEKIFESDYYPPAFLVAFEGPGEKEPRPEAKARAAAPRPLPEGMVKTLSRTFQGFSQDSRGREILKMMGAEGFEEIPADWLEKVEGKYDAGVEKK